MSKAAAELRAAQDSKPVPESFPTRLELLEWQRGVEAAQKAVDSADERGREASEQLTGVTRRLREQGTELQKLAQAEEDLRTAMSGRPVRDREFGLSIPAEKF
jgi:hypothetical protein